MKTTLISTFVLAVLSLFLFLPRADSADYTTLGLPEGARVRLGKGPVYQITYSPHGARVAVATSVGAWLYDGVTGEELSLFTAQPPEHSRCVAFSPNGKTLASGGVYSSYLWDVETGQLKHTLKHPTITGNDTQTAMPADRVTFSPDGKTLAIGHAHFAYTPAGLWNVETGQQIRFLEGAVGLNFTDLAFSPDGKTLAGATDRAGARNLVLWDVETGQVKHTLRAHRDPIVSIVFTPNGKLLVSGDRQGIIHLWDVETGQIKRTPQRRSDGTGIVALSPDGKTLVSTYWTGGITFWDVETGQEKRTLGGGMLPFALSPDGNTLAHVEDYGSIAFWDVETGEQTRRVFPPRRDNVTRLTFSPDGTTLWTSYRLGPMVLWDVETGDMKRAITAHMFTGTVLEFSPDGEALIHSDLNNTDFALLWDVKTGEKISVQFTDDFRDIGFGPDGKTPRTLTDGRVYEWDVHEGNIKNTIKRPSGGAVVSSAFSPDGSKAVGVFSRDRRNIVLWDVDAEREFFLAAEHTDGVVWQVFSLDGTTLATMDQGGNAVIWDAQTGEKKRAITGLGSYKVAMSPGGKTFAAIEDGNRYDVTLWDVETGAKRGPLPVAHNLIDVWALLGTVHFEFSPDGKTLATQINLENQQGTITLWDVETGEMARATAPYFGACAAYVAFSPDGKTLASLGSENKIDVTVVLWDVETAQVKYSFTPHKWTCHEFSFSPDGATLATTGTDRTVLLWDLMPALAEPEPVTEDVNGDGVVNIQDLVAVAGALGETGENDADVNGDGVVNIQDLVAVAAAMAGAAAAPAVTHHQVKGQLTSADVREWIAQAQAENLTDPKLQRGIRFLHYLLAMLTLPEETKLLANYPNPFNPETWIPYQLAKPAEVTLTIYDVGGNVVRTLALGHQPAGFYEGKSRSAYWDGRNSGGEPVASGIYFYTLSAGDFSATRKMLIRK